MNGDFIKDICDDNAYRIKHTRSLLAQIKKDYAELNQLWERFNSDKIGKIEIDELLKKISWVKEGLKEFIKYRNKDVEGVLWVDAGQIVKDLEVKENQIINIIGSVSSETEYSHLR
jgi:hypothetical protein